MRFGVLFVGALLLGALFWPWLLLFAGAGAVVLLSGLIFGRRK